MAKTRFASAWLVFGVSLILQSGSNAQPVVAISGRAYGHVVIYNGQAFATSWTQTNRFTNVTLTVRLTSHGVTNQSGRAYLTTRLGPGTTSADEIASTTFEFPPVESDVTLFSGLTLELGRYYLSLVGNSDSGSAWISGCTAHTSFANGVTLGPDYGFSGVAPYQPAVGVHERPFSLLHFSVIARTNTAAVVPPSVQMNLRGYSLDYVENLLMWESVAGDDRYQISRSYDRKYWDVIATNLTEPRFRDDQFKNPVGFDPVYYKIIVADISGEIAISEDLSVIPRQSGIRLSGISVRPSSDIAVSLALRVNEQPIPGGVKAMLEVGNTTDSLAFVGWSENFAQSYKFAITNLQPATTYWYRLSVVDINNVGFTYLNSFITRPFSEPAVVTIKVPSDAVTYLDEDTPMRFTLITDEPFQRPPTFTITRQPPATVGSISGASPNFLFTPVLESDQPFTFEYSATDGTSTNIGQIDVVVNPINDPPVTIGDFIRTREDEETPVLVRSLDFDAASTSEATLRVVRGPTNGTFIYNGIFTAILYIPNRNFSGVDHFTVVANDGEADGNIATIKILLDPVNDGPIATHQSVTVLQNTPQRISLPASDVDGDGLGVYLLTTPSHGVLSARIGVWREGPCRPATELAELIYTPAPNFVGTDRFEYGVFDGVAGVPAEINITVAPPGVRLEVARLAGNVVLSWTESGHTLETASSPAGPWTSLSTQNNSYTAVAGTDSQFFRLRR